MTTARRYNNVAIVLHWTIAAFLIANLCIGLWFTDMAASLLKNNLSVTHKSIGLTILMLSLLRLLWRLSHKPPPRSPARFDGVARALHWLFYLLLILVPLAGWSVVSISPLNLPTRYLGLWTWPWIGFLHDLPLATRKAQIGNAVLVHNSLALLTALLVVLHVAAALWHRYVLKDGVLAEMAPWTKTPQKQR
jgi:cytochrome b561